jgi:hypothetical protein
MFNLERYKMRHDWVLEYFALGNLFTQDVIATRSLPVPVATGHQNNTIDKIGIGSSDDVKTKGPAVLNGQSNACVVCLTS